MSDSSEHTGVPENPYESPRAEVNAVPLATQGLTETMLFYLRGASPWLRFVGIVTFIGLGLAVAGILVFLITLAVQGGTYGAALIAALGGGIVLIAYAPILVVYFFIAYFTFRFGSKIRGYLQTGDPADLEQAFKHNKSLWTLMGVFYIIGLALGALLLGGYAVVAMIMVH